MKYAIKVMLSQNDWIYITEDTGGCSFDLQPVLFDDQLSAQDYADNWRIPGREGNVIVVPYLPDIDGFNQVGWDLGDLEIDID